MGVPTSPLGLLAGTQVEVVGIDENADDGFRVYLGRRMHGIYVLIDDAEKQDELRRMWANTAMRIVVNTPPDEALYREEVAAS